MEIKKIEAPRFGNKGRIKSGRAALLGSGSFRREHIQIGEVDRELLKVYADNLNFYSDAPTSSITLHEFEKYATERLKMLRLIERQNLETEPISRYTGEYFNKIKMLIKDTDLPTYYLMFNWNDHASAKDDETVLQEKATARRIDHISHFLLRLAFARTDEQRKWFIALEVDFLRFKIWDINSLALILKNHGMEYEKVSQKEKIRKSLEISNASIMSIVDTGALSSEKFYVFKVPFTHALDLVRARKVYLSEGYAYVPQTDFSGLIAVKFRIYLSESLSILKKNIHLIEEDERLRPFIQGFEKRHLGSAPSSIKTSGEAVAASQLPSFSLKSFPLCMKNLYDVVQKDHHLKHWGRLQLGLFFRGLGLPMDEAVKFWRTNFTKRPEIDSGRFDKQYLYNIRHMYGQEGKRADYTPYSCMKVINSSVGPGDHHGCPFRHSDATPLRVKLVEAGISQEGIKEIMKLIEQKHYQVACQKYFELTHDGFAVEGGVNHPNQYFLESRSVLTGKKTIKSEGVSKVPVKRTLIYSQKSQTSSGEGEPMDITTGNGTADDDMEMDAETDALMASLSESGF